MIIVFISILLLCASAYVWIAKPLKDTSGGVESLKINNIAKYALLVVGVIATFTQHFTIIDQENVGHLKRKYFGVDMMAGQIIANQGQQGPQAEILGPGLTISPFIELLYEIEEIPVIEIPQGSYGLINAKDGLPLRDGQYIADPWPEEEIQNMLKAEYFLGFDQEGIPRGQKGTQLTVLPPGKYRINKYLFAVTIHQATNVPTGHVAVIRSNVQTSSNCTNASPVDDNDANSLDAPTVSKGCIGVWDEAYTPGKYRLNEDAYIVTQIPTRAQVWEYKGGYTKRTIDLTVEDDGSIKQKEVSTKIDIPENAADAAINVRVEGWTVPVDVRVLVQVRDEDAPKVVAGVGSLKNVEDKIITPAIRDVLRTIGGSKKTKVLDLVEKRDEIAARVRDAITPLAAKAGVTVTDVRLGEPAIPPEQLVATLRKQLAAQLKITYDQEKLAQKARISVEKEKATANQQGELIKAKIKDEAATFIKNQQKKLGEGKKLYLQQVAQGQESQAMVLGKDRVMQLQIAEMAITAAKENPDMVKVPYINVSSAGEGGSIEGAAAILGSSSNILNMINRSSAITGADK